MKALVKLIPFFVFISIANANPMYGDQDCQDTQEFATVTAQCTCIMNNAYDDSGHTVTKSQLDALFHGNPELAIVTCRNVRHIQPSPSDVCAWGINFYDTNNCHITNYSSN